MESFKQPEKFPNNLGNFYHKTELILCFIMPLQDGTHRVTPGEFKRLFITMFKVGEKWLPAVKGLLPDHTEKSYRLQNRMIKYSMNSNHLELKVESLMSDFERGERVQKCFFCTWYTMGDWRVSLCTKLL